MKRDVLVLVRRHALLIGSALAITGVAAPMLAVSQPMGRTPAEEVRATEGPSKIVGWAMVNPDGTLSRYRNVSMNFKTAEGIYRIVFDRTVHNCSYSATPHALGAEAIVTAQVTQTVSQKTSVWVYTHVNGNPHNAPFHLQVIC